MTGAQLSALYDAENQWAADDDFFLAFVNERPNSRVLDLGCGTGRMTLAVAADGHAVVGIDPNPDSLAAARGSAALRPSRGSKVRQRRSLKTPCLTWRS